MKKGMIILVYTILSIACNKKQNIIPTLQNPPPANGSLVSVTINQNLQGIKIPSNFEGFSYEVQLLTNSTPFLNINNMVLIQLIKNLGNGILRVGGSSSDGIFWSDNVRNANTGKDSLTVTDIDKFSTFTKATGWDVLFGLDLVNYNPSIAANEASYIYNRLQNNLYAFQTGNEPDIFAESGRRSLSYTYSNYQSEWNNYFLAVRSSVPNSQFAGPDVAYNKQWISSFASTEYPNIKLVDGHYYRTGPATDTSINYKTILTPDKNLPTYLQALNAASSQHGLPYRISECNSVYAGGKLGVSNTFASTLWALDFMWTVAENNGQGVNFHGGGGGAYTPIAVLNGIPTPRPLYYAMLAFKNGSNGGTIIPSIINNSSYNCSAYACENGGSAYLTLINKDSTNLSFNIQLNNSITTIKVMRLLAPSITSTTGVTLGGNSVNSDGTFNVNYTENYTISNKTNFIINIPAGSAAILNVQ